MSFRPPYQGRGGAGRPPASGRPGPAQRQFRPYEVPGPKHRGGHNDQGYGQLGGSHGYDAGGGRGRRGGRGGRRGGGGGVGGPDSRDSRPPQAGYGRDSHDEHGTGPAGRSFRLPVQTRDAPTEEVRLERLARERVSRTLFIRNVAYETVSSEFQAQFAAYGEIKEWYDVIQRRGMVFVTFYDVRAAEAARKGMMGSKLFFRPIDVHFSLPKDHDQEGPCDREKNQGSLMVTLHPRRMLEEHELSREAERSGAIKSIRTCGYPEKRIVEYYDSRAAVDFHDRMSGQSFMGGTLEMEFIWDVGETVNPDPVVADQTSQQTMTGRGLPPHRQSSNSSDPRRSSYGSQSSGPPGRYDDRGDRDRRDSGGYRDDRNGPSRRFSDTRRDEPPVPAGRLQEARKVQDLLTSLGNVASLAPAPPSAPAASTHYPPYPPPAQSYPPPAQSYPPPPQQPAYAPPPPQQPPYPPAPYQHPPPPSLSPSAGYGRPSAPGYGSAPYPPAAPPAPAYPPAPAPYSQPPYPPPPSASPPAPSSLPPSVLAILQQQKPGYTPPQPGYTPQHQPPQQGYGRDAPPHQPAHQQAPGYTPQPRQDGYDPKSGSDVGSLLAMLGRQ